jgi:hypothetical protein
MLNYLFARKSADFNGIELTFFYTGTAFDADFLIDKMGLLAFPGDGVNRTVAGTGHTTHTILRNNDVLH